MQMFKKGHSFIYHSLFWLVIYLLWVFVFHNYSFSLNKTLTVQFCYLIFITADYYTATYFIVPRFLKRKQYALFIIFMVLLIAVSALLRSLVSEQISKYVFTNGPKVAFGALYLNSVVNIFIWVELIVFGKMIFDRIYDQQQMAIMEKERVKHELDFLKAQINPHALFNSLNSIYGHIDKSNQTARNILLQFSGLLRYQLYDCSEDKVSLEKEIEYIRNYVAFQQLRKDDNLVVNIETCIAPGEYKIAPLLLVTLTENAFKFVSSFSDKPNSINIKIIVKDSLFGFHICNTTELNKRQSAPGTSGIGLVNLKRRLELLYPDRYKLTCDQQDGHYQANLEIELE
ncbi:MAG TPA: histidine kinase [Mucilaginibacter sp.]|jgi:sensor histidine kinase YesM|nr:histidine kinase [Mucilaginibacter sp.]